MNKLSGFLLNNKINVSTYLKSTKRRIPKCNKVVNEKQQPSGQMVGCIAVEYTLLSSSPLGDTKNEQSLILIRII